jgi:hypothetical protein
MIKISLHQHFILFFDAPSHFLKNSNVNLKVKTMKEEIEVCSPPRNTLGVKRHARTLGCELGRMSNELIIHTNLHKPNNKLVNA